jgi:hypothetical protein
MGRLTSAATLRGASWVSSLPLVAEFWRELLKEFFDSYRPELHYMRGPGPRWRERHEATSLRRIRQAHLPTAGCTRGPLAFDAAARAAGPPPGRPRFMPRGLHPLRTSSASDHALDHVNATPCACQHRGFSIRLTEFRS